MASLYLKNIGPVQEVDIQLNRINIFIGPQSSGKSTVAKIISFCNWLEKDCVLEQDVDFITWDFVAEKLVNYHNLQEYLTVDSVIRYQGQNISLEISGKNVKAEKIGKLEEAFLTKNAYIPSERNMLAIPSIYSVTMPKNYLQEFIVDWLEIRTKYSSSDMLSILNLGESYCFSQSDNADRIRLSNGKEIRFSQASSGLQSVTPLCVCIDYLTRWIYEHEENRSAEDRRKYSEAVVKRNDNRLMNMLNEQFTKEEADKLINQFRAMSVKERASYLDEKIKEVPSQVLYIALAQSIPALNRWELAFPRATNLVIEEPEQNLFPKTQVELVYYILTKLQHKDRPDSLVLTTHSPYILYALNHCMLAALSVQANEDNVALIKEFSSVPEQAWVDPAIISVWELEEGRIRGNKTIQDERGLIRGNFFDRVMKNVMADFNSLINFIS